MLIGKFIGLRPLQTEDVWLLFKWFNDRRVLEDLGAKRSLFCVSMEEERGLVEKRLSSPTDRDFIIMDLEADRAIGWASLSHIDQRNASAQLYLVVGETSEWGKDRGKEAARMLVDHAFNVMNLHKVHLRVPEYNRRAVACFAACGFQKEGVLRDDHYHMGTYMSSFVMSTLRNEGRGSR